MCDLGGNVWIGKKCVNWRKKCLTWGNMCKFEKMCKLEKKLFNL